MKKRKPWTVERLEGCLPISRSQLEKKYGNAAMRAAKRLGVYESLFPPQPRREREWTVAKIWEFARTCKTNSDFKGVPVKWAIKDGFRESIATYLKFKEYETIANKYDTFLEFRYFNPSAYNYCKNKKYIWFYNLIDDRPAIPMAYLHILTTAMVYTHSNDMVKHDAKTHREMLSAKIKFHHFEINFKNACRTSKPEFSTTGDYDKLFEEAMKYNTMSEFKTSKRGAWAVAEGYEGLLEEIEIFMMPSPTTCDNDAIYVWEAVGHYGLDGSKVYKIGVTSWRLGNSRIKTVAAEASMEAKIIRLVNIDKAFKIEKELLSYGEDACFKGFGGATEFRIIKWWKFEKMLEVLDNYVNLSDA